MKANVLVFTQNLKINSLSRIKSLLDTSLKTITVTTHKLFENEKKEIESIVGEFYDLTFSDLITDQEMEKCDVEAFHNVKTSVGEYYNEIKKLKNQIIVNNLIHKYNFQSKYILCTDLGIDVDVWRENGFQFFSLDYYYTDSSLGDNNKRINRFKYYWNRSVYSARINGKKYVFYGRLSRIGYRMNASFKLDKRENCWFIMAKIAERLLKKYPVRKKVEHITTIHESNEWVFPRMDSYKVGIIQDGYLPPNYSSQYLKYVAPNVHYYAWDALGMEVFQKQGIKVDILSFRKKIPIPNPIFRTIKTVLCVASGAGDWTALKNRSDEDNMIIAFTRIAQKYPQIKIIYRCHPTWVHPSHQGVNSINRVAEYFSWTKLPNLELSVNIPETNLNSFQLSYSRNSLEADLQNADVVFGEHSVSMIDAAFMRIPFASVNMTNRRDFFCGMTDFGFPHCESVRDIEQFIDNFGNADLQLRYVSAVEKYNNMTFQEQ